MMWQSRLGDLLVVSSWLLYERLRNSGVDSRQRPRKHDNGGGGPPSPPPGHRQANERFTCKIAQSTKFWHKKMCRSRLQFNFSVNSNDDGVMIMTTVGNRAYGMN